MNDPNRTQLGTPLIQDPNRTVMGTAPTLNATVTIKPVQCPICKTFNPVGVMFCVECGLIFERSLPDDAFGAPIVQLPVLIESGGREHPVRPGATIIGREGDIAIADSRVSRRHAQVLSENGAFFAEDLGSTNGSAVNGTALSPGTRVQLNPGDILAVGGVELHFGIPGAAAATLMPVSNKTAAIAGPPKVAETVAYLVGPDMEYSLQLGVNTFGRKTDNNIQIGDPYVSGKHGVIEVSETEVHITDIGSTNGTLLNEAKLSPNMRTLMQPDDVIRLGSLELRIRRQA